MGFVIWPPFEVSTGQRPYLGKMSIFQPEHVRLVEAALNDGPDEGMTGKQVWDATDRAVPELTVHLILREMVHKGLMESESTPRSSRREISVFRAL